MRSLPWGRFALWLVHRDRPLPLKALGCRAPLDTLVGLILAGCPHSLAAGVRRRPLDIPVHLALAALMPRLAPASHAHALQQIRCRRVLGRRGEGGLREVPRLRRHALAL